MTASNARSSQLDCCQHTRVRHQSSPKTAIAAMRAASSHGVTDGGALQMAAALAPKRT